MTTADGVVLGSQRIVNNGSPERKFNIVILSEGFQQNELPLYQIAAQKFADVLRKTRPFDTRWCCINIYRVDVVSVMRYLITAYRP